MKTFIVMASLFCLAACSVSAAQQAGASEILARLGHSYDGLEDYSTAVQAEVSMERVRVPRMSAKLYFKQPDKIHFEAEGFAMLPREGIGFNPTLFTKNYTGELAGTDTVGGRKVTKLELTARSDTMKIRHLTIWVDTDRWVVVRMESAPYTGRSIRLSIEYLRVENRWWLPSRMIVSLNAGESEDREPPSPEPGQPGAQGRQRTPRTGTITVTYSDYGVNQHLPDELFEKSEPNKK